ncbi:MAG: hypothetical protein J6P60_01655 [Lachnospiraceae bacterium]|nr:hypothetical protein [Lachnospiraceae bacterium]
MQIGAVGMNFQPYVFNTNSVSANSLNKISPIADDALASSVDYYSNSKNQNPLKMGQTANYADVLAMQFQLGQNNATRIMKPEQEQETQAADIAPVASEQISEAAANTVSSVSEADQGAQSDVASYLMNRAIEAYTMDLAG